jgi:lipopolysaccharide transport system ATP-binding protein
MSENAIIVENLSKKYVIGHRHTGSQQKYQYTALRDVVARGFHNFARKTADVVRGRQVVQGDEVEDFWALKDVTFEVKQGEVLGIIGRNGAGKSTLLKILSHITDPTQGRVTLSGRVASLLEVGTGFHPELTGRENIFLNGAILGMTRREIRKKIDEIVAFAEIEKFLDTPVKHYSSGMYVRLAFAVAAHLEPEILIVDEVLAVGDTEFQKKCLGKMDEVSRAKGRTVLFVSHSMPSIERLCKRVIALKSGKIWMSGPATKAIAEYLSGDQRSTYVAKPSSSKPTISRANVEQRDHALLLSVDFQSPFPLRPPVLGFIIHDSIGNAVYGTNTRLEPPLVPIPSAASGCIEVAIPTDQIRPNRYIISLWLGDAYTDYCELPSVLQVEIPGVHLDVPSQVIGSMRLPIRWNFQQILEAANEVHENGLGASTRSGIL